MPSPSSIPGYVARYGDALRRLTGGQPSMGALQTVSSSRVYDPSLSPGQTGLGQEASQGVTGAFGALPPAQPALAPQQISQADAVGALGTPPPATRAPEQAGGRSFWDIAKSLTADEKDKIADSFEKKGVDIKAAYKKLENSGQVDPGLIKKNPDGTVDRGDMGLFLLESGLRTMKAAGEPGSSGVGAVATGQLDTMDARRGRAAQAAAADESNRRFAAESEDKAADRGARMQESQDNRASAERIAATRETGDNKRAAATIEAEGRRSAEDRLSRKEIAEMTTGASKRTFIDEDDGTVYWADTREPVMVKKNGKEVPLKGKTQVDRGVVTDKDLLTATEKHRAALDENLTAAVTIPGEAEPVRWKNATDEQKDAYLADYSQKLKQRAGSKTPNATGANVFDQFD